jgi:hypothetical protein
MHVEEVVEKLKAACKDAGGQTAWGAAHGVSGAYVHDCVRGRRDPGESILRALGLQREVRYIPRGRETVALYDADGVTLVTAEVLP